MTVENLPAVRGVNTPARRLGSAVAVPSAARPVAVRRVATTLPTATPTPVREVSLVSVLLQLAAMAGIAFVAFYVLAFQHAV